VAKINSTAVELTITFLKGTSFIRAPQYFTLYVLSQDNPTWLNPYCTGQHVISPNKCTFDMTWIQYPYQQGPACYNGGWIWCTLPNTIVYNITMNLNTQTPGNYYLVMVIQYPPGFYNIDFVWNITGTNPNYPTWLYPPSPLANVLTPG
jgi:hypothetical protein